MGGGGSSNKNYDTLASTNQPSQSSLDEFVKTTSGQKYSDEINSNKGKSYYQAVGGGWRVSDTKYDSGSQVTGLKDASELMNAYQAWLTSQAADSKERQDYVKLAGQEQGRDATILTGPGKQPVLG